MKLGEILRGILFILLLTALVLWIAFCLWSLVEHG